MTPRSSAATAARFALGAGCVAVTLAWAIPTVPTLRSTTHEAVPPSGLDMTVPTVVAVPNEPSPEPSAIPTDNAESVESGRTPSARASSSVIADARTFVAPTHFDVDPETHAMTSAGCAPDLSAEALGDFFGERLGPLVGWDNPHVYRIDDHRTLWIVHDSYLDFDGTARSIGETRPQLQNLVMLQEGACFTLVHGGTPDDGRLNFEIGVDHADHTKFLWPLGGEVDGDTLWIFWAETVLSDNDYEYGGGAIRHPTKTWLASYDVDTLERLTFAAAPNSGVFPMYGFAVESDAEHSYLFGNSNLLNYVREGGYENGPHSATKMFLGRVPRGQLDQPPDYWNGADWTEDAELAVPISERFWAENTMQPRYLEGRWVSVVKRDGFFGNEIVIDVADDPWGPWIEAERIEHIPEADVPMNSYHPVLVPWSGADDGLIMVVSENAQHWDFAVDRLDLYRPRVITADWPFPDGVSRNSELTADVHG